MRSSVQEFIKTAKASLLVNQSKSVLEVLALADATKNTIFSQRKRIDLTKAEVEQVKIAIATLDEAAAQIQTVRALMHNFKGLDVGELKLSGSIVVGTSFMFESLLEQQSGLSTNFEKINAVRAR
jgi:hypothetical protein